MYLLSQGMATVRSTFSLSLEFRSASEENLITDNDNLTKFIWVKNYAKTYKSRNITAMYVKYKYKRARIVRKKSTKREVKNPPNILASQAMVI
jgi:hypothetical protein